MPPTNQFREDEPKGWSLSGFAPPEFQAERNMRLTFRKQILDLPGRREGHDV